MWNILLFQGKFDKKFSNKWNKCCKSLTRWFLGASGCSNEFAHNKWGWVSPPPLIVPTIHRSLSPPKMFGKIYLKWRKSANVKIRLWVRLPSVQRRNVIVEVLSGAGYDWKGVEIMLGPVKVSGEQVSTFVIPHHSPSVPVSVANLHSKILDAHNFLQFHGVFRQFGRIIDCRSYLGLAAPPPGNQSRICSCLPCSWIRHWQRLICLRSLPEEADVVSCFKPNPPSGPIRDWAAKTPFQMGRLIL